MAARCAWWTRGEGNFEHVQLNTWDGRVEASLYLYGDSMCVVIWVARFCLEAHPFDVEPGS